MAPRGLVRSFVVLWWVLGATLLVLSVRTVIGGLRGADPHPGVRWDFLVYAAAVFFVAVHGPLTAAQWRHAVARPVQA